MILMKIAKIEINKFPVKMASMSILRLSHQDRWRRLSLRSCTSKRLNRANNSRTISKRSKTFWRKISWIITAEIIIQISKVVKIPDPIIEISQEKVLDSRNSHTFPRTCRISSKRRLLMMIAIVMSFQPTQNTISRADSVNFKAPPVLAIKVKIKKTLWVPPRSTLTEICSVVSSVTEIMYQRLRIQFSPLAS